VISAEYGDEDDEDPDPRDQRDGGGREGRRAEGRWSPAGQPVL